METPSDVLLFDRFRLDPRGGGLFRCADDGAEIPIALGSRALDILALLIDRRGDVVTKDEIVANVWRGALVEGSNLTVQISALRRVLEQGRAPGSCIQTVVRRGYRFVMPVSRGMRESAAEPGLGPGKPLQLPDVPSIAVLPFLNMSGDPEQDYFVDGMVEEIITALSRIRWLFVIARNSSFTYKGLAIDVKQVGRELGVRYVLKGSVRKAGERVRITAQLLDATTGTHLWADRFDGPLEDVFELQDKVASNVAGVIEPTLQAAETARSAGRPTSDLTAYDLYLRAYAMFWSSVERIPEALRLTEQAIARDPSYGPTLAWAAMCCVRPLVGERERRSGGRSSKGH